MNLLLALSTAAWAVAPDKVAVVISGRGGELANLQVSSDLGVVVGVKEDGKLGLLDLATWEAVSANLPGAGVAASVCRAESAVAVPRSGLEVDAWWVLVGCREGAIHTWTWDGASLEPYTTTGSPEGVLTTLTGGGQIVGLYVGSDNAIYAMRVLDNQVTGLRYTLSSGVLTADAAYLANLFPNNFQQAVFHDLSATSLVTTYHGSGRFSQWSLLGGAVVAPLAPGNAAPLDLAATDSSNMYFVENNPARLALYNPAGSVSASITTVESLDDPRAVLYAQGQTENLFVLQEGNEVVTRSGAAPGTVQASFEVDFELADLVDAGDDWFVGGTADGDYVVLSANPWINDLTISPGAVKSGDTLTVRFTPDEGGEYTLDLDGTRNGEGTRIATGTATAGTEVIAEVEIDALFTEGRHTLWARVKNGLTTGYVRGEVSVDNDPVAVVLREGEVGYGNRSVLLTWSKLSAEDIEGYRVYLSSEPFTAADYPSGGPTGQVGRVESPLEVPQPTTGSTVSAQFSNLVNGRTYWVAVRSYDASTEGPMSNVVSVTPQPTQLACDLSPEDCRDACAGTSCGTVGGAAVGWGLAAVALGLVRRRRGGLAALLVAVGVLGSTEARAQNLAGTFARDETPAWTNFEFHFGGFQYADSSLQSVYGDGGLNLRIEAGLQIFRYGEIDLGLGYLWDKGNTLGADGSTSAEGAFTEWMPFTLTGTLRLHILDEQPIVPYGSIGFSYVSWRESPLDAEGGMVESRRVSGAKMGWHWAVGGNILLDVFQPRRASMLEARTGINDTWLVIEYRQTNLDAAGGLDLSGWNLSGGLKIDY